MWGSNFRIDHREQDMDVGAADAERGFQQSLSSLATRGTAREGRWAMRPFCRSDLGTGPLKWPYRRRDFPCIA
jgi:hypothetical protein